MGPLTTRKGRERPSFLGWWWRWYGRLFDGRFLPRLGACCLFGLMSCLSTSNASASACSSYDSAWASCMAAKAISWDTNPRMAGSTCRVRKYSASEMYVWIWQVFDGKETGWNGSGYRFNCGANLCSVDEHRTVVMSAADFGPVSSGGPHRANGICDMAFVSAGILGGVARGVMKNTGSYTWDVGSATPPAAPDTDQSCDVSDLLCFNPGDGTVCANVGNHKICSTPSAVQAPPNTGNCTSGQGSAAGSWICGGSPTAPRALDAQGNLVPESAKVADQQGTILPTPPKLAYAVNVTVYNTNPNNAGGPSGTPQPPVDTNQGKADENGHCPDGSVASAGGCGAGYADNGCDAPPSCSGDALLCGQLRETHGSKCDLQKFFKDNGADFKPGDLDSAIAEFVGTPLPGSKAWWNDQVPDGCVSGADGAVNCTPGAANGDPVEVAAPDLKMTRYWGGRAQCPGIPEVQINGQTTQMSVQACTSTGWLADIILAAAYIFGAIRFARAMNNG